LALTYKEGENKRRVDNQRRVDSKRVDSKGDEKDLIDLIIALDIEFGGMRALPCCRA